MDNESTEIDIIIPTFNRKDSLKRCINSIINNNANYLFNIVVVDDVSTDGTHEMLKSNFPFVNIISNKTTLFPCLSMYKGITSTHAKFVVRVDDDNELMGDCLPNLISCLENDKTIAFCGTVGLLPDRTFSTNLGGYYRGFLKRRILPDTSNLGGVDKTPYSVETVDNVYAFRREIFTNEDWKKPCKWFPWGMEDAYQQFSALKRNYNVVVNPKAITIHHQARNRKINELQIKGQLRSKILCLRECYSYKGLKLIMASLLYTAYILSYWIYKSNFKHPLHEILESVLVMIFALKSD